MDFDFRFSQFEILTGAGSAILCLFFVSVFTSASAIENDIATQVADAVDSEDLYWSSVEASGQSVLITGAAPDVPARLAAIERARVVPGVTSIDNQIRIIGEDDDCQENLDAYAEKERLRFRSGKADLVDASVAAVGMLAMIIRTCSGVVEVAGHTDAKGDSKVNMKLSRRRADVVAKYLVNHGVAAEKIVARGYGETQPVADNETEDGRKANRRIEFRVLGEAA